MNQELKRLCEEDQRDLREMPPNRIERDRKRRVRVKEIIDNKEATEGIDFVYASVIFQHGETLDDWWTAHRLAVKASQLGFQNAKWLSAVTMDRWLLRQEKPTKYGTQYVKLGGIYRVARFDPKTTDKERQEWDVPSMNEILALSDSVQGLPERTVVDSLKVQELQIIVVGLSRDLAHSPTFKGKIIGYTENNRPIYKNSQDWFWIKKEDENSLEMGWIKLPYSPKLAHIIVGNVKPQMEASTIAGKPVIWVHNDDSLTVYVKDNDGVWAITGTNRKQIESRVLSLIS